MTEKEALDMLYANGIMFSRKDFEDLLTENMWEEARGLIAVALANECLACPWKKALGETGENACASCPGMENLLELCKFIFHMGFMQGSDAVLSTMKGMMRKARK